MLIRGISIYLDTFKLEHLLDPTYYQWLCDPVVVKYIGREELLDGVTFQQVEEYVNNVWQDDNALFFAIHDKNTKTFIGTAKLSFFGKSSMRSGIADLGLMIGKRVFWGKGIGTEVIKILSKHAYQNLGVRKLTAGAISSNTALVKAFKNSGYIQEGFLKNHFFIDKKYHDQILFAYFPN